MVCKNSTKNIVCKFYPLPNGLFPLGIWSAKIPQKTLVWYKSLSVEPNSLLQLTSEGHLVITHPNGTISQTIDNIGGDSEAANSAHMQDDGNFVLKDSNLRTLWESFDSPPNTMLPGQTLKSNQILYSKGKGASNYSLGNFMLEMQGDGNLILKAHQFSDPSYWYTSTLVSNLNLVFNESNSLLYLANGNGNIVYSLTKGTPTPVKDYYHRATIDENGNFQQYVYHKRNGTKWERVWRAIDDPCKVDFVCGIYGLCTSPNNESVKCDCIQGYIPFDQEDVSKRCHPETVINYCSGPNVMNLKQNVFDDTDFQFYPDFALINDVDLESCKKSVMDDCNIIAATYNSSTSTCVMKRMPLLNARNSSSSKGQKALLKVAYSNNESNIFGVSKKKSFNVRVFFEAYYHPYAKRLTRRRKFLNATDIGINFREFTFDELHEATDGFSRILGKGSSGKVYRGTLIIDDAEIGIAVKKLEKKIEKSENEFMTELKIIGLTHHKNLVKLLGFCMENKHRVLVYELMPNGALSSLLFGQKGEKPQWSQRGMQLIE
ncbi:hypothetical protein TSUD_228200 [Trifolium subterraneum]|uniref:non-specific serine/threonine protein kinase n=1 Tax=Trifolium subterraneum TaxID=3900 RepID=A0A2Z6M1M2_TRISU|nr:hypothetical protein TSUD_228200 [Trifolium subterraneum]